MTTEWIDIADTAMKIGLGSLITGAFTYLGIRISTNAQKSKFLLEHKIKILETLAEDIEIFFNAWNAYSSQILGIAKSREKHSSEENELSLPQREIISKKESDLMNAVSKRNAAISKLKLMKEYAAADALEECNRIIRELRDPITFDRVFPIFGDMKLIQEKEANAKNNVYTELSNIYEKLQRD